MGHSPILLLSQNYAPLEIVSVEKAFTIFYKGDAEAVTEDYETFSFERWKSYSAELAYEPGNFIRCTNQHLKIPPMMRFTRKVKVYRELDARFNRKNIYIRDSFSCQYCGYIPKRNKIYSELNLDHVTPRSRGGKTSWENLVTSCIACNTLKKNYTPDEAGMRLVKTPRKPPWSPKYSNIFSTYRNLFPKEFSDWAKDLAEGNEIENS